MRKITLALAAAAALGFAAPAPAQDGPASQGRIQLAQADVKVKVRTGERTRKKIVIRHDRGRHVGFDHSRHRGYASRVTVVKKKPGRTVIKRFEG